MAPRPTSDAVVALRSLRRRYRALFAGLGDDESPDDLARRKGPDGRSADDHVIAATDAIATTARTIGAALGAVVSLPHDAIGAGATVGDDIDELAAWAEALADGVEHVPAQRWADTDAAASLWTAVDTAVDHLRHAEQTLSQVRGRP